jgi:hypothetical protein
MGNTFSYSKNVDDSSHEKNTKALNTSNLIEYVDMIATNYVLKQNMIDMIRFTDKEYYDNMVILTSYILKQKLSSLDIGILKNRVLDGYANDKMTKEPNQENNQIFFSTANELKEITIQNEKKKQKALLIISKFYMKVMTLFSAVVATIDPQYVYEDEDGMKKYFGLRDFNNFKKLDKETKHLKISQLDNPIGLVKRRLFILKNKLSENNNSDNYVTINPGELVCEKPKEDGENDMSKLKSEIGIKELDALYYDVYDHKTNTWNERSKKMQEKYEEDLVKFHQIFTGKKNKPDSIKSFMDIEMLKFHELTRCVNRDFYEDLVVSKNDHLFKKYMEKIYMIQNITKSYKKKMLSILKRIFVPFETNAETSFIIAPGLNIETLLKHQDETKECINQIYMNCERLFIEALLLYEKMYENQHGILTENQIESTKQSMVTNNVLDANRLNPDSTPETPMPETPITPTPEIEGDAEMGAEDEAKDDGLDTPSMPVPPAMIPTPSAPPAMIPTPSAPPAMIPTPSAPPAMIPTPSAPPATSESSQPDSPEEGSGMGVVATPEPPTMMATPPLGNPESPTTPQVETPETVVSEIPTQPIPPTSPEEGETQKSEVSETPSIDTITEQEETPSQPQESVPQDTPALNAGVANAGVANDSVVDAGVANASATNASVVTPKINNTNSVLNVPVVTPQTQMNPETEVNNGIKTPDDKDLPLQGGFMEKIRNSIIDVLNNR